MLDIDLVNRCQIHLDAINPKWGTSSVCHGFTVSGGIISNSGNNRECHSWIPRNPKPAPKKGGCCDIVGTCYVRKDCKISTHVLDAFMAWFVSDDMPLSEFILNKNEARRSGVLIDARTLSRNTVMWMCKVLRYTTEAPQAITVWNELVQGGVHPMFALCLAGKMNVKNGGFTHYNASSHVCVFHNFGENIKSLFERKFDNTSMNTNSVFPGIYEGRSEYVSPRALPTWFTQLFSKAAKDDGWGGTITVPANDKPTVIYNILKKQEEYLRGTTNPVC